MEWDLEDVLLVFVVLIALCGCFFIFATAGDRVLSRREQCFAQNGTYLHHDDVCIAIPAINLEKNK